MASLINTLVFALWALPQVFGHTWIEQIQLISSNGSFVGNSGYPRGYMARTDPGYNGFSNDYLVPQAGIRINSSDLLCHPSQRSSNYSSPAYPKIKVAPGDYVAMQYLENGHTTLPNNQKGKPKDGGTVFVYGTTTPSADEKIADVLEWTKDGSGGNKKGFLMTAQNFDDGRCHQINCGNMSISRQEMYPVHVAGQPTSSVERWCETDVQIPSSVKPGQLTVYWVWQWPTAPGEDCFAPEGKDEYYTTCSDFDIVDDTTKANYVLAAQPDKNTLVQNSPQTAAVPDWQSRTALTQSPPIIMIEGTKTMGIKIAAASASNFLASCSASQSAAALAPTVSAPAPACGPVTQFSTQKALPSSVAAAPATSSALMLSESAPASAPTNTLPPSSGSGSPTVVTATQFITITATVSAGQQSIGASAPSASSAPTAPAIHPAPAMSSAPPTPLATSQVSISTTSTMDSPPALTTAIANSLVAPTLSVIGGAPAAASSAPSISAGPHAQPSAVPPTRPPAPLRGFGNGTVAENLRRRHARHFA